MTTLVLFAHGKESGAWGSKIRHLADIALRLGAQVISPDYSDLASPEERVVRLLSLPLPAHQRLILVGSSMGGYVSTVASRPLKPKGLFLMAPAFYLPGYAEQQPMSGAEQTCVVFGRQDEMIPVAHGIRFAEENRAELHVIEGDHRLNGQIDRVGELFESFLRRLEVGAWKSRFQTPEQVAAVARPFIGRTFHRWFANFESGMDKPGWSHNGRDLDDCLPKADYGDVQVAFWGGGDLTLTIDTGQAFMGGWPVAGLRLADRSIPQLYAEADVRQPGDRSADRHCRYFPLR
jgi:pimeloyl-ACP methyl ester carboxylesterase